MNTITKYAIGATAAVAALVGTYFIARDSPADTARKAAQAEKYQRLVYNGEIGEDRVKSEINRAWFGKDSLELRIVRPTGEELKFTDIGVDTKTVEEFAVTGTDGVTYKNDDIYRSTQPQVIPNVNAYFAGKMDAIKCANAKRNAEKIAAVNALVTQ